ncbi:Hypothetical protein FKW44_015561, partial [Caligus rogercresseyi]
MSISFTCLSVRLLRWSDKRDFSLEMTLSQSTEVIGAHEKRNILFGFGIIFELQLEFNFFDVRILLKDTVQLAGKGLNGQLHLHHLKNPMLSVSGRRSSRLEMLSKVALDFGSLNSFLALTI